MRKVTPMVGAIIQARMTSTRMPGKVMAKVQGRPLLDYLFERLSYTKKLEKVVLATTTNQKDDVIVNYAIRKKISCWRGSEANVLERYWETANEYGLTDIVRITADCPLLDPEVCERLIQYYHDTKADYAHLSSDFAEGLDCEIFSKRVLDEAYQHAVKQSEHEHVTRYFHNHPDVFQIKVLGNETNDGHYRFTVDGPEDFEVVKAILEKLHQKDSKPFGATEIKKYLDKHPEIKVLNQHIIRNEGLLISLKNDRIMNNK